MPFRLCVASLAALPFVLLAGCALLPCQEESCHLPSHPKTKVGQKPCMMTLASDLDRLERYIEKFGSVVPKVPDVWGQARLTKHREDFERQMAADLGNFDVKINGALSRADSAFFSQSVALGVAAQSPVGILGGTRNRPRNDGLTETVVTQLIQPPAAVVVPVTSAGAAVASPGLPSGGTTGAGTAASPAVVTPPAVVAVAPSPNFDPITLRNRPSYSPAAAISLEPTLVLEQKARYLNLLNQLRRTNEGDDTADSAGYSLNLVRIPVSILPGKATRAGHGAEVTFTLSPVLGEDLLASTFRTLLVNDIADHLGFPLVRFIETDESDDLLTDEKRKELEGNPELLAAAARPGDHRQVAFQSPAPILPAPRSERPRRRGKPVRLAPADRALNAPPAGRFLRTARNRFSIPTLAPAKGMLSRQPFPSSEIIDVYGPEFCFEIAYQTNESFKDSIEKNGYAHLPDVQAFLLTELSAAYAYLADSGNVSLWSAFCTPDLVTAIRNHDFAGLAQRRTAFREHFLKVSTPSRINPRRQDLSVTAALAWCLIVDAALLTNRLILDMKETATAKNCAPFCGGWLDFAHPHPSPEARQAFNAYVKCRWPIRVFALDPANQDQNLIDELATRRETQLALSMAFVSGRINASSLTRYARRLESQAETIALNRTQVGFSHGEDTFGWRFTPRFQTTGTPSNLTVLFRDQLIGGPGPDAQLRQRRLEPGPRECVAIVLMPSFVPCLTCDSVSNWFSLANPRCKLFDHTDAMKASRAIKTLKVEAPNVVDHDCFREGDFSRLLRRIDQLEARLPTQTSVVPVPIVNTLGGFKMFNNGTTDYAPELYGFYGARGVRIGSQTTLFLVGDHFSPLRSQVIVGNQSCPIEMLSRQVVKVTVVPPGVPTAKGHVTAHIATPYGVSREIEIPIVPDLPDPAYQLSLTSSKWYFQYRSVVKPPLAPMGQPQNYQFEYLPTATPASANLVWTAVEAPPESLRVTISAIPRAGLAPITVALEVAIKPASGSDKRTFSIPLDVLARNFVDRVNAVITPTSPTSTEWPGGEMAVTLTVASGNNTSTEYKVQIPAGSLTMTAVKAAGQTVQTNPPRTP